MKKFFSLIILLQTIIVANAQYTFQELDISPLTSGMSNKQPIVFNNKVYFTGVTDYNSGGTEPFVYDGNTVSLFQDLNNPGHSYPADFFVANNNYFLFTAYTAAAGRELYASDGNTAWMLKDIRPGASDGMENGGNDYFQYIILNNKVYFFAREDGDGFDLWRTDGTALGTEKVAELNNFNVGVKDYITVFNNAIYFTMNVGSDNEMYKYEDVGNTVTKVFEVNAVGSSDPALYTVFDNKLFFVAANNTYGREWFYTDGIAAPLPVDVNNGSTNTNPTNPLVYNNKLYFVGAITVFNNRDPYTIEYDGTLMTYKYTMLKDFTQGALNGTVLGTGSKFVPYNGLVYFAGRESGQNNNMWQLYKTNGEAGGTQHAVEITNTHTGTAANNIYDLMVYNNKLLFTMIGNGLGDNQLWVTDGTTNSLTRLSNAGTGTPNKAYLTYNVEYNNSLMFRGANATTDYELWRMTDNALLPVSFVSFTAKAMAENKVQLLWTTEKEINASHYEIETSTNGREFNKIGKVNANNSVGENKYSFIHNTPISGYNYYRIKQVDKDGKFVYTQTEKINLAKQTKLTAYPNPARDNVVIKIEDNNYANANVMLVNTLGNTVLTAKLTGLQTTLNVSSLASGNYIIKIMHPQHGETITRFIKQ